MGNDCVCLRLCLLPPSSGSEPNHSSELWRSCRECAQGVLLARLGMRPCCQPGPQLALTFHQAGLCAWAEIIYLVAVNVKTSLWAKWMSQFRYQRAAQYQYHMLLASKGCQEELEGSRGVRSRQGIWLVPFTCEGGCSQAERHWVLCCSLLPRWQAKLTNLAKTAHSEAKHFTQTCAWMCEHWEN